jgi:septal ring factor EnvC (AmiA/AmiB activator)
MVMEQYKNTADETDTVPVPKPAVTKGPIDIKVEQLEKQLVSQHQEIAKLRRDINRLKSDIGDIINVLKSRG